MTDAPIPSEPTEIDSDHLPDEYENVVDPGGEDVVLAKDQTPVADETPEEQ